MNDHDEAYIAYQQYSHDVQALLIDYQFIEEGLRMVISGAYNIIRTRVGREIAFKYTYRDTEKNSLGKLVTKFEKLSNRKDLAKEIKGLVRHRNEIAHLAFLLSIEQQNDINFLTEQSDMLRSLRARTKPVVSALLEEVGRIEQIIRKHNEQG